MKFEINLKALQEVTSKLDRVLKSTLVDKPILDTVKIVAEKAQNVLQFTASNGNDTILVSVPAEGQENVNSVFESGEICIPKHALRVLDKLKDYKTPLQFSKKGNTIFVDQNRTHLEFISFDASEYPVLNPTTAPLGSFAMSANLLTDIVNKTAFAVADSETRPVLQGIQLQLQQNGDQLAFKAVATDSHRLSKYDSINPLNEDEPIVEVVVPALALVAAVKTLRKSNVLQVTVFKNMLLVNDNTTIVFMRLLEGNYPSTDRLLPVHDAKTTVVKFSSVDLFNALDVLTVLNKDNDKCEVTFSISNDMLNVKSHGGSGAISKFNQDITAIKGQGEDIVFTCTVRYIKESLKAMATENVAFAVKGPLLPITLHPIYGADVQPVGNITQLVLPVRTY